jgi:hypothetical protein
VFRLGTVVKEVVVPTKEKPYDLAFFLGTISMDCFCLSRILLFLKTCIPFKVVSIIQVSILYTKLLENIYFYLIRGSGLEFWVSRCFGSHSSSRASHLPSGKCHFPISHIGHNMSQGCHED